MIINFANFRSILCLNGSLPAVDFFQQSLPIIAADGGANTLIKMGIYPDLVIGDMDSIESAFKSRINLLSHLDQDYCDYEKALQYLERKNLLPAIIVGMNGGNLDHILNNVNLLMQTRNIAYAPPITCFSLSASQVEEYILPTNTKISLLGIPHAVVSSVGLKWELHSYALSFPGKTSCFNRTVQSLVRLKIHEGAVLVLIHDDQ